MLPDIFDYDYSMQVWQQPVLVLGSNFAQTEPQELTPPVDNVHLLLPNVQLTSTFLEPAEMVVATTFASTPVLWDWELRRDYRELGAALSEMTEISGCDDWSVGNDVYAAACFVAAKLMAYSVPAPRVFNHGPKSVVFNWTNERDNLYVTISADRLSALVSSPERIRRRLDLSIGEFLGPTSIGDIMANSGMVLPAADRSAVADLLDVPGL